MHTRLYSIAKVCGATIGIKALIFTDTSNVVGLGAGFYPPPPGSGYTFIDTDKLCSFGYEKGSASLTIASAVNGGGDYDTSTAVCHVPRGRNQVQTLLKRFRNRTVFVIAIDRYDNQYYLYDARASWTYGTGDVGPAKNGYNISFRSVCDYMFPVMSGSGDIPTAPAPPGTGGGDDACCVSIYPLPIAYSPTDTGNSLNLSQLVTTQDGSVYFIDYTGRSKLITRPPHDYYKVEVVEGSVATYVTIPVGYPLPDPADYPDPTYDPQSEISRRLLVKLAPRWLTYLHPDGYHIDYATRRVYFETSIDGATLEFYFFTKITPRPL